MNRILSSLRKRRLEWTGVLAFTTVGAFLRFFGLNEQSLWIDEGFTLMQARAIAEHGYPLLDSGLVEKKDALLPFLLAPFTASFDAFQPSLSRSCVAIFGSLSIPLAFLIGKTLREKPLGFLFAFLLTFSYSHIAWSRQIRGYEVAVFFTLLSILFLAQSIRNKIGTRFFLAAGSSILATLSKSFGVFLLPAILFLGYRFQLPKQRALFVALGIIGVMMIILFFPAFIGSLHLDHPAYLPHYLLGTLWGSFGILLPIALLGYAESLRETSERAFHLSLGIFFAGTLLFFSFFVSVQEDRYLLLITPLLFLYASLFIYSISTHLPLRKIFGIPLLLALMVGIDMFTVRSFLFFPQRFFALERGTPQPPFRDAYEFLRHTLKPNDTIISPYPFMDILYLNQPGYALPISYTGRAGDSNITRNKEYYSGTRNLFANGIESGKRKIASLRENGDVYLILDSLALKRIDSEILTATQTFTDPRFTRSFSSRDNQEIVVYRIPKMTDTPQEYTP